LVVSYSEEVFCWPSTAQHCGQCSSLYVVTVVAPLERDFLIKVTALANMIADNNVNNIALRRKRRKRSRSSSRRRLMFISDIDFSSAVCNVAVMLRHPG